MKHQIEFANFHCTSGPYNLIDLAAPIVIPAFFSTEKRRFKGSSYSFLGQTIVDIPNEGPALAFEFVKDTSLNSEQTRADDGQLVERYATIPDSPSALALLVLATHKLVYLPKTSNAPTVRELESTCRWLFGQELARYHASLATSGDGGLNPEHLPAIQIEIMPMASASTLVAFFSRLKSVRSVRFELFQTNTEYNPDPLFQKAEEARKRSKAKKAVFELRAGPEKEGLDKEVAKQEVESAAKNGTARVVITGRDSQDKRLSQDNENLRLKVPADFIPSTAQESALQMAQVLTEQQARGTVAMAQRTQPDADLARWETAMEKFRPKHDP